MAAPPPDPAEALYYEGMAAYQHRHWREALERFTRLKELQPTRPGLDALLDEVRWFLQLEAAAPVGRDVMDGARGRATGHGDSLRLTRGHSILLIALAILSVAGMLLVAFQDRLPGSWLPWRNGATRETQAFYEEGQTRLAVGDYEGAEVAFQKILEITPSDLEAQRGVARARRQQMLALRYASAGAAIAEEDWERAGAELATILAVEPAYADARERAEFVALRQRLAGLYEDGSRLYDLGQWPETLAQFEKVRALDPGYRSDAVNEFLFVCHLNAADALLRARGGDVAAVEQAVGHHEKALAIHPRNRIATDAHRLSRLYLEAFKALEQGDGVRARTQLTALLSEAPDYAGGEALVRLYELTVAEGRDALSTGDITNALEIFDRALGMAVADKDAAKHGKQIALAATLTPTASPTSTPPPTPVPTPWAVVAEGPIEARSGPDRTYPVVGEIPQSAEVTITGRRPDGLWLRVCCVAAGEAWVAAQLLDVRGPLEQATLITPPTVTPAPAATRPLPQSTATPQLVACVSGYVRNTAGGDPLPGWTVTLQDPSGTVQSTRSNLSGFYGFSELQPGTHVVRLEIQPGWRAISPLPVPIVVAASEICVLVDIWNEREGAGPPPTPVR